MTFNLAPDSSCKVSADSNEFIPIGSYDISPGGNGLGDRCEHPYILHLLVNTQLRTNTQTDLGRAEPNILQIHSAEVRLMTVRKETIVFDRINPPLPNPFLVTAANSLVPSTGVEPSTGIAAVEAIPTAYAGQLNMFDGGQIMAEVQIFGTTLGDVDVDFKPFVYPIQICDGCLTSCLAPILESSLSLEEFAGEDCTDNAGADGRVCIDPDC